mmetsp:Transcript_34370/g.106704  ORF Transcript_34370/g.106704 Transcript_34370/m.106704 type:complete len:236 (-) Transcript_34370:255-962(-)
MRKELLNERGLDVGCVNVELEDTEVLRCAVSVYEVHRVPRRVEISDDARGAVNVCHARLPRMADRHRCASPICLYPLPLVLPSIDLVKNYPSDLVVNQKSHQHVREKRGPSIVEPRTPPALAQEAVVTQDKPISVEDVVSRPTHLRAQVAGTSQHANKGLQELWPSARPAEARKGLRDGRAGPVVGVKPEPPPVHLLAHRREVLIVLHGVLLEVCLHAAGMVVKVLADTLVRRSG